MGRLTEEVRVMARQERRRPRTGHQPGMEGSDSEPPVRLPRRALTDTRAAARLLERIRRLLTETRQSG
jgi:hypothetical protein